MGHLLLLLDKSCLLGAPFQLFCKLSLFYFLLFLLLHAHAALVLQFLALPGSLLQLGLLSVSAILLALLHFAFQIICLLIRFTKVLGQVELGQEKGREARLGD